MSNLNRGSWCVFLLVVGLAVCPALGQEHRYYPGWLWDTVEVRGGTPDSNYDVELHNLSCTWFIEDSGTTDSDGDDTNRITRWAPNYGIGRYQDKFRIHYTSGPSTCTYEYGTIKGRGSGNNTRNSNVTGSVVQLPEADPMFTGLSYTIVQNVQDEMDLWSEAAWLQPGSDFTLTLFDGFTFDSVPTVSSLFSDIVLGTPLLSGDATTLTVPIVSNQRINALGGIEITGTDIWTPGGMSPGDYFYEISGVFDITSVLDTGTVVSTTSAVSNALGFQKVPEPAGPVLLTLGVGGLGLRRRRR